MRAWQPVVIIWMVAFGAIGCADDVDPGVASTGEDDVSATMQNDAVGGADVIDLFVRDRLERASSMVVGEVVEERVGRRSDPVDQFDPADCESDDCAPPADQPTIQQYDAVVAVERVIAGHDRGTVLIRRNRSEVATQGEVIDERASAGFAVEPGDRVIVAVEPAVDGTPDHFAHVLLLEGGRVVANHWNPDNTFRASFNGLTEDEAIEKLKGIHPG